MNSDFHLDMDAVLSDEMKNVNHVLHDLIECSQLLLGGY